MTEINLLDQFYFPLKEKDKLYSSKEFKLLHSNGVDTAELEGVEKDQNAGNLELGKENEKENEILARDVIDYVKALPKDTIIGVTKGMINGLGFVNDVIGAITYGTNVPDDDSIYNFVKQRVDNQLKNLEELEKPDPLTTKIIGALGQDAAFIYPVHKKLKSIGIPKQYTLPLSIAIGSTLAFQNKTSLMVNTETIQGLKKVIDLPENTPAGELYDNAVQFIEFLGFGFAFDKIFKSIKSIRNIDVQKSSVVTAGSLSAGEGARIIEEKAIDKKMKNLGIDDDQSSLDLPDDNLIAAIGPEAAKLAVQYLKTKGKTVQDLKKLSGGTGRSVFELDDDQVIKIAKMQRGIRENMNEMNDYMIDSWRPKVFERGDDFVVVENVKRADNEVRKFLKPLQEYNGLDWKERNASLQETMVELGLEDFLNYDLLWNDFKAARNWGKTKDGRIVLIDGGALDRTILDKNVPEYVAKDWQNILSGRRKEGMGKFIITITGGSSGYKVLDNIENNIISEKTEK